MLVIQDLVLLFFSLLGPSLNQSRLLYDRTFLDASISYIRAHVL